MYGEYRAQASDWSLKHHHLTADALQPMVISFDCILFPLTTELPHVASPHYLWLGLNLNGSGAASVLNNTMMSSVYVAGPNSTAISCQLLQLISFLSARKHHQHVQLGGNCGSSCLWYLGLALIKKNVAWSPHEHWKSWFNTGDGFTVWGYSMCTWCTYLVLQSSSLVYTHLWRMKAANCVVI